MTDVLLEFAFAVGKLVVVGVLAEDLQRPLALVTVRYVVVLGLATEQCPKATPPEYLL